MRSGSLAVATLALLAGGIFAPHLIAQEKSPTPRMGAVAVELNGSICSFGGYNSYQPLSTVECYDPAPGQWRSGADMPTARGLLGVAVAGGDAYLIGGTEAGRDKLGVVERYNSESDTWSRVADLPTARNALSAASVDGRIYAIGGWGVDDDDRARDFDTVEIYDPRTDRWSPGAPMPAGRSHMAMAEAGGRIYAIGGWMQRAGRFTALNAVTIYDPEADRWEHAANLPTPRFLATAVVIDGRIYVLGGWTIGPDGQHDATDVVEVFDPATGFWARDAKLPRPRAGHASAVVDTQILLFGGASKPPLRTGERPMLTAIDRYIPADFASLARIAAPNTNAESGGAGIASVAEFRNGGAYGRILEIEEPFGNLRTDLIQSDLERLGLSPGSRLAVHIGSRDFPATFGKDFSDVARGEWVAFVMPDGTVTVARNFASAAEACGCVADEAISVAASDATKPQPGSTVSGGTLEGVVRLSSGPLPSPRQVENTTDPEICGQVQSLDDLLVSSERREIANVIVSLAGVPSERFPTPEPDHLVLDNRNCRFAPHAAAVTIGSSIELINSDPTLHTVHFYGPSEESVSLPFQGMSILRRLTAAGIYQVKCDLHGWMQAFLRVDVHPFHAVTDARGAFRVSGIPPGDYTLEAWHEKLGFRRVAVEIRAGQTANIELEYANPEKG